MLDDESDDDSGAPTPYACSPATRSARPVAGAPAPAGWVGKNWACHQLAAAGARGPSWSSATPTSPSPRAPWTAVAGRDAGPAGGRPLGVPTPGDPVEPGRAPDRAAGRRRVLCLLPFALLSARAGYRAAATANGSVLAFGRAPTTGSAGSPAVRGELVEDVALARLTRRAGLEARPGPGRGPGRRPGCTTATGPPSGASHAACAVAGGSRVVLVAGLGLAPARLHAARGRWALRPGAWLLLGALGIVERRPRRGQDRATPVSARRVLIAAVAAGGHRPSWRRRCAAARRGRIGPTHDGARPGPVLRRLPTRIRPETTLPAPRGASGSLGHRPAGPARGGRPARSGLRAAAVATRPRRLLPALEPLRARRPRDVPQPGQHERALALPRRRGGAARRSRPPAAATPPQSGLRAAVAGRVRQPVADVVQASLPAGPFDAVAWSSLLMRRIISATFFDDQVDSGLLEEFLSPLDRPLPGPFLRRPRLFARMDRALRRRRIAARPRAPWPRPSGAWVTGSTRCGWRSVPATTPRRTR